jgi:hypothetical protein
LEKTALLVLPLRWFYGGNKKCALTKIKNTEALACSLAGGQTAA